MSKVIQNRRIWFFVVVLAAAFAAMAVIHIQLSHFATFDVQLTFWVLLALYAGARLMDGPRARWSGLAGIALGLALATKISVLPLVIPMIVAHLLNRSGQPGRGWFLEALDSARCRLNLSLWAYVIMPEHVHVIVWPREPFCEIRLIRTALKVPVQRKALPFLRRQAPPSWPPAARGPGRRPAVTELCR